MAWLLPEPYYVLTVTVPAELRGVFLHYPQELYASFFAAVAESVRNCSRRKHFGGDAGSMATLHSRKIAEQTCYKQNPGQSV